MTTPKRKLKIPEKVLNALRRGPNHVHQLLLLTAEPGETRTREHMRSLVWTALRNLEKMGLVRRLPIRAARITVVREDKKVEGFYPVRFWEVVR